MNPEIALLMIVLHSPDPQERRQALAELKKRGMVASAWARSKIMVCWMFLVFLLSGLTVLVIVWGVRRLRALPAPAIAEAAGGLGSRALAGAVLGGLAILLGLVWWAPPLQDWLLFHSLLGYVAVPLAGLVLASTGLVLSIKAKGGDMQRQAIVGQILNLFALLTLAIPVFWSLLVALLTALDISLQ